MPGTRLTDLPPELLDHITTYLYSANSLANLSRTNKQLHAFVEKDAWQTFAKLRFPSLRPATSDSLKRETHTLTSLSRAWDRRAFVSRYTEPGGDITAYPGGKKLDRWKRPKGQTIGFTPYLDVFEGDVGARGRREVLAYSAGAEVCVRVRQWQMGEQGKDEEQVRWLTYRPLTAYEGRDDVTSLHLLRPREGESQVGQQLITGTANGDLQLLRLPDDDGGEMEKTYFTTQGQPVRSSSLLQHDDGSGLLAAEIGDSKICLYPFGDGQPKTAPSSQLDIKPASQQNGTHISKAYRAWSTKLLSDKHLAVGLGPSEEPIHIYELTPSGISTDHVRKFCLQIDDSLDDRSDEIAPGGVAKKPMSSVYPIAPLPHSSAAASNQENQVFLSGAYDGIIRLHDLRSDRDVVGVYSDPTDDSAIYSLLTRGRETLVAGTSRHNLLKVFDLRLGAKCYSYLNASGTDADDSIPRSRDWSLFLKPHNDSQSSNARNGWGGGNRRQIESSIYTLASSSPTSPYIFAGISNNVLEFAFTDVLDAQPDPCYFRPWTQKSRGGHRRNGVANKAPSEWNGWSTKEVLGLACYDQNAEIKLMKQSRIEDAWSGRQYQMEKGQGVFEGLDWRWWDYSGQ